jgi:hypothetical protein
MFAMRLCATALTLLTAFVTSVNAGLPLGLPPLPEDPLLARIAPEECLLYTRLSGSGSPDAKSANQTEQFLAEPEVQDFLNRIEQLIVTKLGETGPGRPAIPASAIRWGEKLLGRPAALFVSSVVIGPQGPDIRAGLVINVGGDVAELKAELEKLQGALPVAAEKVEIGGVSCYRIKVAPAAPSVTWCTKGKYFLAGVGEGSLEGILQRARGAAPAWLTSLRKQLPVERPSAVTYVNVKKIVEQFAPMGGPQVRTVVEAMGLDKITTFASVAGLDGEGIINRSFVSEAETAGASDAVHGKPLQASDLASIPRGANIALAVRLDLPWLIDTGLAIANRIEPRAAQQFDQVLKGLSAQLGVDLRKDVIDSLGDVWCAYNSPDEGGLVISGLTAVVRVKDHERLSAAHAKLLAVARAALGQSGNPPPAKIEHVRFAEQDIYFVSAGGIPFAPAWCLTREELVISTFPQQIKAYLSRGAGFKSLAAVPEVAAAFKDGEGPIGLWYFDARSLLDYLYPVMCMGIQMASRDLAREGIDLNVSMIPSAPTIYRHLRPGVTVLRRTSNGTELISRSTVPGSSMDSAVPFAVGLLLPAVSSAREAARRAQSMNNLKQIALAMLNHESANNKYPAACIADKTTGKPLLSWRVTILPYIEEQALYQQFHLDEPWDSEHNKPLIARMPQTYRSPNSTAAPGMTNYLTIRGKDTVFPGKDGIRIADITDGTSNTIMAVEASDAKAVPWTKPDDIELDETQPMAGLLGLRPNGFLAAFCDGSVRFISATIDSQILCNLFNRHDGKLVDQSKF